LHSQSNNFKLAYEAYKNYHLTNDSIFNDKITRELERKQLQFDFDKREKLLQIKRVRNELNYAIQSSVLIAFIIILIFLFFLLRGKNKRMNLIGKNLELEKINLQQNLELKNKELTSNIIYLVRKNELIEDIRNRLLKLSKEMTPQGKEMFQSLISDLQMGTDDKVWDEFKFRFNQVYNRFHENLKKQFPTLTPAEIRLWEIFSLNISLKEISNITHQSTKSIEVARSRLRKKLQINNSDINLVTFLMEI